MVRYRVGLGLVALHKTFAKNTRQSRSEGVQHVLYVIRILPLLGCASQTWSFISWPTLQPCGTCKRDYLEKKRASEKRSSQSKRAIQSKQHHPVFELVEAPCIVLAAPPWKLKLIAVSTLFH